MGRFNTNRFNPWTNLHKMLGQKVTKTVVEDVEPFKSEVCRCIIFLFYCICVSITFSALNYVYYY